MISHNAEFYEALCPEKWILGELRRRRRVIINILIFIIINILIITIIFIIIIKTLIIIAITIIILVCVYIPITILSFYCFIESGRLTVMGAEWMEEVEKARKKAEKLGIHLLDDDDHWLLYIAWLIGLLMSIDLLFDDRNANWYVWFLIPRCINHIVAYYCYLHSLDDNSCDVTQPSELWTMIRRRRRKMRSETPSLKVLLSLFVYFLRRYCDCNYVTKCN